MVKKVLIGLVILVGFAGASYYEHNYTRDNCETILTTKSGITVFRDKTGHHWEYETTDYKVGEKVHLKMHDNYTNAYIGDDIIKEIVKAN